MKQVLEDKYIKWNNVYKLSSHDISLDHAFPTNELVKLHVRLPLTAPECFELLAKQRKLWDKLVRKCISFNI